MEDVKGEQPGGASKQNPKREGTWGLGKHKRGTCGPVSKGGTTRLLLRCF